MVKDLGRVESLVEGRSTWVGYVIALTNDPSYWTAATHGGPTNARAFRLYQDIELEAERSWDERTGSGTMSGGRHVPLILRGKHRMAWSDYSQVDDSGCGRFRALVIPIE